LIFSGDTRRRHGRLFVRIGEQRLVRQLFTAADRRIHCAGAKPGPPTFADLASASRFPSRRGCCARYDSIARCALLAFPLLWAARNRSNDLVRRHQYDLSYADAVCGYVAGSNPISVIGALHIAHETPPPGRTLAEDIGCELRARSSCHPGHCSRVHR